MPDQEDPFKKYGGKQMEDPQDPFRKYGGQIIAEPVKKKEVGGLGSKIGGMAGGSAGQSEKKKSNFDEWLSKLPVVTVTSDNEDPLGNALSKESRDAAQYIYPDVTTGKPTGITLLQSIQAQGKLNNAANEINRTFVGNKELAQSVIQNQLSKRGVVATDLQTVKQHYNPQNLTEKLAVETLEDVDNIETSLANSRNIEEAAVNYFRGRTDQTGKQAKYFQGKVPPIVQGQWVDEFIHSPNVVAMAEHNPVFAQRLAATQSTLYQNYPEYAVKKVQRILGQEREDRRMNSLLANNPSVETTEEIAKELLENGKIGKDEYEIWDKKIKPILQVFHKVGAGSEVIPTADFADSFSGGIEEGVHGIWRTLKTIAAISDTEKKRKLTREAIVKEYSHLGVQPVSELSKVATGAGHLTGYLAPMILLNAAGSPNAVTNTLMFMGANADRAKTMFPGEQSKQDAYTLLTTGADVVLGEYLPGANKSIKREVGSDISKVIKGFTDKTITAGAAKQKVLDIVGDRLKKLPAQNLKTAGVLTGFNVIHNAADAVFGGRDLSLQDIANEAVETGVINFFAATPLSLMHSSSRANVNGEMIRSAVENPKLEVLVKDSGNPEILKNYERAKEAWDEIKDLEMPEKDKGALLLKDLQQKVFEEKAASAKTSVVKEKWEKLSKQVEIEKNNLYNEETSSKKIIEEFYNEDLIPKQDRLLIENNETGKFEPNKVGEYLKYVAQQANGLTADWKPAKGGIPEMSNYPPKLIEMANERWAKELEEAQPKLEDQERGLDMGTEPVKEEKPPTTEQQPSTVSGSESPQQSKTEGGGVSVIRPEENRPPEIIEPPQSTQAETTIDGGAAVPPKEPPKTDLTGEFGKGDRLDKLANNIPDSGRVSEYMSKETIEKYTGEEPTNDQRRGVQELEIALSHGEKIIEEAKLVFGNDYVEKTLDYINRSKAGVSNKALMYVSLENALGREKVSNPGKAAELTKQQALVYAESQKFARENSLALNYQKLRRIAKVGYDIEKITDNFFSVEELAGKQDIKKAVEADADAINKEAERMEVGGMTPEIERAIEAGVEKEVAKIYEAMPKSRQSAADKAVKALEQVQKKLRSRTYDAGLGIPVAIIDAGISTIKLAIKAGVKIADAVELGIKKIKERYGKPWGNEDKFRNDMLEEFEKVMSVDTRKLVKDALIAKGFGQEITVKGEKKQILDWKKLAGTSGTVEKIKENVEAILKSRGKSQKEIDDISKELADEYEGLRYSIIEKAQNELAKRNKETVSPEQKSAAKKLAELYTYGLFEKEADTFENALNKALGAKVSEQGFHEAKEIARAMEAIYTNTFKGTKLNDVSAKAAIQRLDDRLRILLHREARKQGNFNLKAANIVRNYFEIQQTMLLNNMRQALENPFSGLQQNIMEKWRANLDKTSTPELAKQRRKLMKDVYRDMALKGGIGYGKVESQFVNRQHIDDYINKMSDNQLYHGIMSVATGKATLHAMDAMFKSGLTERKFTTNLIKILTSDSNPNKMNKDDAIKFVSERLTGQNFIDAQKTAKEVTEKINKEAGHELLPTNQEAIDRFANDIVKSALEMGGKITKEQIEAAYNAAYKAAGLGLGHEANNPLSSMVKGRSAQLEADVNLAIKDKDWNKAAAATYESILFRNILNPFVGGGTNWVVLKLEKSGLGLFTGLYYRVKDRKASRIDVSSEQGLRKLEKSLYAQSRAKDSFMRGLIGGSINIAAYLAFLGIASSDEYEKWRAKNPWAARYLDVITPEFILADMASDDPKQMKKYLSQTFNKNDAFDSGIKLIKAAEYFAKGDASKGWGALGEAIGMKLNAPVPWRLVKDGQVIYQGITGQDPYHGDYRPSEGFMSGVTKGGVIEWLGWRPTSSTSDNGNLRQQRPIPQRQKPQKQD